MRTALVCDWLPTFGGAEHVLSAFGRIWTNAPLYTTVASKDAIRAIGIADVRTTRLQHLFRISGRHEWLLPLMPRAIEDIDLSGFDVIVSSSHAVGKGIIPPSSSVHVCYCHTPMRYAWEMEEQYLNDFRIHGPLRWAMRRELKRLRRWDLATARRVDAFIANSYETQERIRRIYGRDAIVVPPPVEDRFFRVPLDHHPRSYYLAIGRLVPYKRFDLLIAVANALRLPLTIAGRGREEQRLRALAGPTVTFAGFVPDEALPSLYAGARALLFPQHEDAGIVPLEAQACGTPVIAYGRGGALDSVRDGSTGMLVSDQTVDAFVAAIRSFDGRAWSASAIREHARGFCEAAFAQSMREIVERTVRERRMPFAQRSSPLTV